MNPAFAVAPKRKRGQVILRHPDWPAYRCVLPDLAGFTGFCCTGPSPFILGAICARLQTWWQCRASSTCRQLGCVPKFGRLSRQAGGEGGHLKSRAQLQRALPQRGPAPSCLPTWGSLSPTSPSFKSHPLHSRCRASDTFSRLWEYMARWYYWRAPAQTLRTDVSRAKFGGEGGHLKSRAQLRPPLPQRGRAPSCRPTWGNLSPTSPPLTSHPLHRRCRASDTFSPRWEYMARWHSSCA